MHKTNEHFNKLSPGEAERLAILAEECGEVIQVVGKILRHGYTSHHPDNPTVDNEELLYKEIIDVYASVAMLVKSFDIDTINPKDVEDAEIRKKKYSHHQ